jgi:hypothetical protein
MGNSGSSPPPDSDDVLVHSFQLDADTDFCSLPVCWPRKQVRRENKEEVEYISFLTGNVSHTKELLCSPDKLSSIPRRCQDD